MELSTILIAIALMLMFEGLGPLLFPNKWRQYLYKLSQEAPDTVRQIGLALFLSGAILFYAFS